MSHRHGIGRFHCPGGLVRTGIVDTFLHGLAGSVEHILVGYIAHGLSVHLHFQRIGLADGVVKYCHHHCQCTHRQNVHCHAGQRFQVAPHAACQVMPRGAAGRAKALFFPHPVGMDEQSAASAEEQHHRAEQVAEHLRRSGKRHGCNVGQQIPGCAGRMDHNSTDAAPGPDEYILGRKAQRIQCLARCGHRRVAGKPAAEAAHMVLGLTAQPMPAQQPDTLQLRPKGTQFLPPLRFYGRRILLFSCLIFDQKGFLLPCRLRCAAMRTARMTAAV